MRTPSALLVCAVLVTLAACSPPSGPLRVGLLLWPAYELPFLAREAGELPEDRVELVDFRSPAEVMRAYRQALVDAIALTGGYALELAAESPEHRIVLVIDYSEGGDALVARPGIEHLSGLEGARIGLESSNLAVHILGRVLQRAGLRPDQVQVVPVDIAEHLDAYRSGAVDAVITYEPMVTHVREAGGHVLFDSTAMPGEIVDVLITREGTLQQRRRELQALADSWFLGQQVLRREPQEAARIMAAREGVDAPTLLTALEGIRLVNRDANRRLLSPGSELALSLRSLAELLHEFGGQVGDVDIDRLLDDRLVRDADAPGEPTQ